MTARRGFTLVEISVALLVSSMIVHGGVSALRYFTRPARQRELTLDGLNALQVATQRLDRELREARSIIYPGPGAPPARLLYLRDFDGRIVVYYYRPSTRELRRATLDPAGLITEERRAILGNLNGAHFAVSPDGVVSWGLFGPDMPLVGSLRRLNR